LRDRLLIQAAQDGPPQQDKFGEPIPQWGTVATRWGKIEPLSGRELWQAQQVQADVTHRIRLRYFAGLHPKHRFAKAEPKLGTTRIFSILGTPNPDERKREQLCLCKEQV
jgi:SPP1 family predicted phage head-tail adaptor